MIPPAVTTYLCTLMDEIGFDQKNLAAVLGYSSHTSIRQIREGRQTMPEDKLRRLEALAALRRRHAREFYAWAAAAGIDVSPEKIAKIG